MKDFKDTYEQKHWEFVLRRHEHYTKSFVHRIKIQKQSLFPEKWQRLIDFAKAEKEKLEQEFPALKGITYPET